MAEPRFHLPRQGAQDGWHKSDSTVVSLGKIDRLQVSRALCGSNPLLGTSAGCTLTTCTPSLMVGTSWFSFWANSPPACSCSMESRWVKVSHPQLQGEWDPGMGSESNTAGPGNDFSRATGIKSSPPTGGVKPTGFRLGPLGALLWPQKKSDLRKKPRPRERERRHGKSWGLHDVHGTARELWSSPAKS